MVYIGFSQGTLVMFYLLATVPEWADSIALFVAMAPVSRLQNSKHFARRHRKLTALATRLLPLLGPRGKVDFGNRAVRQLAAQVCAGRGRRMRSLCRLATETLFGHRTHFDGAALREQLRHFPDATSTMNLKQFAQTVQTGAPSAFDYGSRARNRSCYLADRPPPVDFRRIRATEVRLIYSAEDHFADPDDVRLLIEDLRCKQTFTRCFLR